MADRPPATFPWLLIAASVLLVLVILYVLFVGYLPAKQRIAGLEAELKDLYRREAELQTKIAQQDQRYSVREAPGRAREAARPHPQHPAPLTPDVLLECAL
jgi:type II secretory pathway component PulM